MHTIETEKSGEIANSVDATLSHPSKGQETVITARTQPAEKHPLTAFLTDQCPAAEFLSPSTAAEISQALTSVVARGLTPLLNAYQSAKFLPESQLRRCAIIDMYNLTSVSVDPVAKTLTCAARTTVHDCDKAASQHGLAVVAATWGVLGMGGVALGGGYGWLSGEYGLVADNMLSTTVVLADGSIVTASETENQDLFWGLRGSYTNLGICTDFTFRCHDMPHDVVWGSLEFEADRLEVVLDVVMTIRTGKHDVKNLSDNSWNETLSNGKTAISIRVEFQRPKGESGGFSSSRILLLLFHDGPLQKAQEIFTPLLRLNPTPTDTNISSAFTGTGTSSYPQALRSSEKQSLLRTIPYKDVNTQLDYTLDHQGDMTFASTGFNIPLTYSSSSSTNVVGFLTEIAESLNLTYSSPGHAPSAQDYSLTLGIDFRNGRRICAPENAAKTAFAARFDGCMCYLRARWDGYGENTGCPGSDEIKSFVENTGKRVRSKVKAWMQVAGETARMPAPAYPGFCHQNELQLVEMFGEENYERLKQVKKKYDPGNVFNGGFWDGSGGGRGN